MNKKKWISFGVTIALIIAAVVAIYFMGIWTSIIALSTFALGRFIGSYTKEPEIIEKIVEKVVEVPTKKSKIKKNKKVE